MGLEYTAQCNAPDSAKDFLVTELQHRIRNLLTLVQYLIVQTQSRTVPGYRSALIARIRNLADACELIESADGDPVSLTDLLERTLKPYAAVLQDRIHATGPDIDLEPRLGLALHLIFHELATNACKHGALANSSGRVEIFWDVNFDGSNRRLVIQWNESGGPAVREPARRGFGLNLMTKVLADAKVELRFERTGLICRILVNVCKFRAQSQRSRSKPLHHM
jgi:two-component sensor histidine kinase